MSVRVHPLVLALFLLGCGEKEGDDPGECTDGADNDADGYFDCSDLDCVMSPDCAEADTDTDTDTDSDTDTDTDTDTDADADPDPALVPLTGMTIDYTLAFEFDFPILGVENCDMVFQGVGTDQVEVVGTRATFTGTWERTGGSCPDGLNDAVWTAADKSAYHSFVFTAGGATLEDWYAHKSATGYTTESGDNWYITEMGASFDAESPTATWNDTERLPEPPANLNHSMQVVFTR